MPQSGGTFTVESMKKWMMFAFCLAIMAVLEAATITSFCGQVFHCGCSYSEGMAHCNINKPGPDCPWCSHGKAGFYGLFLFILLGIAASIWAVLKRSGFRLLWGLAAGVAGYLVCGVLVAVAFAVCDGYPLLELWIG